MTRLMDGQNMINPSHYANGMPPRDGDWHAPNCSDWMATAALTLVLNLIIHSVRCSLIHPVMATEKTSASILSVSTAVVALNASPSESCQKVSALTAPSPRSSAASFARAAT